LCTFEKVLKKVKKLLLRASIAEIPGHKVGPVQIRPIMRILTVPHARPDAESHGGGWALLAFAFHSFNFRRGGSKRPCAGSELDIEDGRSSEPAGDVFEK
jgi:hypothetical protein